MLNNALSTRPITSPGTARVPSPGSGPSAHGGVRPGPPRAPRNQTVEAALRTVSRLAERRGARVAADDEPATSGDDAQDESVSPPLPLAWRIAPAAAPPGSPLAPPPGSPPGAAGKPVGATPAATPGARRRESLPVRHALVRPDDADRAWCDWSADPYQGCGFGCASCLARNARAGAATSSSGGGGRSPGVVSDAHAARPEGALQHPLYAKSCFPEALRRDLVGRVRTGDHVALGVTTDPYHRAERHECLTRATLRELTRVSGLRISITTKSTMVTRDLDLLVQVAARNAVQVNLAMTTPDARLARVLEPHLPTPAGSLAALREIRAAGVRAGVFILPVLPGITDAESDLRALVVAARDAGAQFVAHRTSFVDTAARSHLLAVLRRAYPRVAARHELWTRCGPTLPRDVREQICARVQTIARSCGLPAPAGEHPPAPVVEMQRRFEFAS